MRATTIRVNNLGCLAASEVRVKLFQILLVAQGEKLCGDGIYSARLYGIKLIVKPLRKPLMHLHTGAHMRY